MNRVIGYVRVSTGSQQISLEVQEAKIRAMATMKDLPLIEIIVDSDASAKNLKRPGMERVLKMIDTGEIDMLVVAKLDRLTRSPKDLAILLERLMKHNIALVSVEESLDTKSAAGRLVLNVMMSVFQWEREAIGERTKAALQHQKANGFPAGPPPYGWTRQPKIVMLTGKPLSQPLVPNAAEQEVLIKAQTMREAGFSYEKIADALNECGFATRSGVPWVKQYVVGILKSAKEVAA